MSGSNLYQENNFKPCLTKQLLNVFKLWFECGISFELMVTTNSNVEQILTAPPNRTITTI